MCGSRACSGRRPFARRPVGVSEGEVDGGGSRLASRNGCGERAAKVARGKVNGGAVIATGGSDGRKLGVKVNCSATGDLRACLAILPRTFRNRGAHGATWDHRPCSYPAVAMVG
jgi:hypothetical protein